MDGSPSSLNGIGHDFLKVDVVLRPITTAA